MANSCSVCNAGLNKRTAPGLQCAGTCKKNFHATCAGVSKNTLTSFASENVDWYCSICRKNKRKSLVIQDISSPIPDMNTDSFFGAGAAKPDSLSIFMSEIRVEFSNFKLKQDELLASTSFVSDAYDGIITKLNFVEQKFQAVEVIQRENVILKNQLRDQAARITSLEQSALMKQLEIQGIPNDIDMTPIDIVKKIAATITLDINDSDIKFCERVAWSAKDKPKNIIVGFNSVAKKDVFLSKKKKMNITTNIFSSDGAYGGGSTHIYKPIYINELLCSSKKNCYMKQSNSQKIRTIILFGFEMEIFILEKTRQVNLSLLKILVP